MPMYREVGVSARKDEGYDRKKRHYIKNLWKFETNTRMKNHLVYIGKRTRHFCIVFQIKKMKETLSLQEFQTNIWDQRTVKKDYQRCFHFWRKETFAKKQTSFDNCGMMQSYKHNC